MVDDRFDETDAAIVAQLNESPRMAFREISRRLGMSEATVRARVKRLQDSDVLRFVTFVDPRGFGRLVLGVALVDVEAAAHEDVVAELVTWPEVVYLSTLIGEHSLQLQLCAEDESALWHTLHRVRLLGGVVGLRSQVEATVHKLAYTAPRGLGGG